MRCSKARKLISLYVAPDESWLRPEDRRALEVHMAACESCRQDCDESRTAVGILQDCRQLSTDTAAILEKEQKQGRHGAPARIIIPRGVLRRVAASAMAACLALAVLGGWALSNRGGARLGSDGSFALMGESLPLTIELADGSRAAPGTLLETSSQETQCLVLNARHHMVMNAGTRLSIESLVETGRAGCLVRLALGEVYVHVEHDGTPFIVQTPHGRAVITGTIFDVKATETGTTLVVAEGNVRFESAGGSVHVIAKQQSTVAEGPLPPTMPAPCDVTAMTAWAGLADKGRQATQDTARGGPGPGTLPPMLTPPARVPLDLDGIEYTRWIGQNREWFRRQFPWTFDLAWALSRQGIEVDYPELLLRSGDIWRFACGNERPEQFSRFDPNSLLAVSRDFGFDRQWLLQHIPAVRDALERPRPSATDPGGPEELERWLHEACSATDRKRPESLQSYHAAQYLAQTRTLIWLAVRDGWCEVPRQQRPRVLELLREIVTAAQEWQYNELCPADAGPPLDCDDLEPKRARIRAELANTICAREKTLAEYVRTERR